MTMSTALKQEYEEKIGILETQHERKRKELENKIKMFENEQLVLTQVQAISHLAMHLDEEIQTVE